MPLTTRPGLYWVDLSFQETHHHGEYSQSSLNTYDIDRHHRSSHETCTVSRDVITEPLILTSTSHRTGIAIATRWALCPAVRPNPASCTSTCPVQHRTSGRVLACTHSRALHSVLSDCTGILATVSLNPAKHLGKTKWTDEMHIGHQLWFWKPKLRFCFLCALKLHFSVFGCLLWELL